MYKLASRIIALSLASEPRSSLSSAERLLPVAVFGVEVAVQVVVGLEVLNFFWPADAPLGLLCVACMGGIDRRWAKRHDIAGVAEGSCCFRC